MNKEEICTCDCYWCEKKPAQHNICAFDCNSHRRQSVTKENLIGEFVETERVSQPVKQTQQDKILSMHEDGFTPREITNELGCSNGSVYSTLCKFGLKPNTRRCPHCGQHYSIIDKDNG